MGEDAEKIALVDKAFEQAGISLYEYIRKSEKAKHSLVLSQEDQIRFRQLYNEIDSESLSPNEKGRRLEELAFLLFSNPDRSFFDCKKNQRTSTNEIDLLVSWNEKAKIHQIDKAYDEFGNVFMCECKNYDRKVGVTYVGKFYSLLHVSNLKMGILISWEGITGRGHWDSSQGLIRKIALKDNVYIIPLDKRDFYAVGYGGVDIYSLIRDKRRALELDIDYSKYISSHPNEQIFQKTNDEASGS